MDWPQDGSEHTVGSGPIKCQSQSCSCSLCSASPSLLFPGQPAWCLKFSKTTIGLDESSSVLPDMSVYYLQGHLYILISLYLSFSKTIRHVFSWHRWMCQNRQHWAKSSENGAQDRCILMARKMIREGWQRPGALGPVPAVNPDRTESIQRPASNIGISRKWCYTTEGDEAKCEERLYTEGIHGRLLNI